MKRWQHMTRQERVDIIRDGLIEGLTFDQIADTMPGATKNAVVGFCWRVGLTADNFVLFALPSAERDVLPKGAGHRTPDGKRKPQDPRRPKSVTRPIVNDDPKTVRLLLAIDASGFYYSDIMYVAGYTRDLISRYRSGESKPSAYTRGVLYDTLERMKREQWRKKSCATSPE